MRGVRIEVDARDIAARPDLVALVQEVPAVRIRGVRAVLALEDEVGVLVRLGLLSLGRRREGRRRDQGVAVGEIAVVLDNAVRGRILEHPRALCLDELDPLRGDDVRGGHACRARLGGDFREAEPRCGTGSDDHGHLGRRPARRLRPAGRP